MDTGVDAMDVEKGHVGRSMAGAREGFRKLVFVAGRLLKCTDSDPGNYINNLTSVSSMKSCKRTGRDRANRLITLKRCTVSLTQSEKKQIWVRGGEERSWPSVYDPVASLPP
jgi:hypothetical protein